MIPCEEFGVLLSAFADGEATPEEQEKIKEHIRSCKACASLLKLYTNISGELSALPEVPETFRKSVMDRIAALPEKPARRGRLVFIKPWMATVAAAACLALVLLISPLRGALAPKKEAGGAASQPMLAAAPSAEVQAAGAGACAAEADLSDKSVSLKATAAGDAAQVREEAPSWEPPPEPQEADDGGAQKQSSDVAGGIMMAASPPAQEIPGYVPPGDSLGMASVPEAADADKYFAVITVYGVMPEELSCFEFTAREGGYETAEVPAETARSLIEAGYDAVYGSEANTTALVVYYP